MECNLTQRNEKKIGEKKVIFFHWMFVNYLVCKLLMSVYVWLFVSFAFILSVFFSASLWYYVTRSFDVRSRSTRSLLTFDPFTLNLFDTMWSPPFYKRWPCNGDQLVPKGLCIGERESFSSNRSNGSGSEWIWIERQRIERRSNLPLYVPLYVYFYVSAHISVFVSMPISQSRSFLMRSIFKNAHFFINFKIINSKIFILKCQQFIALSDNLKNATSKKEKIKSLHNLLYF